VVVVVSFVAGAVTFVLGPSVGSAIAGVAATSAVPAASELATTASRRWGGRAVGPSAVITVPSGRR
jgi:hypothetical protein